MTSCQSRLADTSGQCSTSGNGQHTAWLWGHGEGRGGGKRGDREMEKRRNGATDKRWECSV